MSVQPGSERHGWRKAQGYGNNLLPPYGRVLPIPANLSHEKVCAADQAVAQDQDGHSGDQVCCGADRAIDCFLLHGDSPCGTIAHSIGVKPVFVNLSACYILP